MKGDLELGARFGRLMALLPIGGKGAKYICICDCGETKAVSAYNMLKGDALSCGCLAKGRPRNRNTTDLSGKKIGKLSVVDMAPHVIGLGRMWNCICECGNKKIVRGLHLLSGAVTSCGCRTGKAISVNEFGDVTIFAIRSGHKILIDSEDLDLMSQHKWRVSTGYAKAHDRSTQASADVKGIFLHRLIMGCVAGDGKYVDHINGNKLDNRKINLRVCTHAENLRNRGATKANKSGLKGAYWSKQRGKWYSEIKVGGKKKYLGVFATAEEAHKAFLMAASEFHGEFAYGAN